MKIPLHFTKVALHFSYLNITLSLGKPLIDSKNNVDVNNWM